MKSLVEYINENGSSQNAAESKNSICLLDTNPSNYDDESISIDDLDVQIEAAYEDFMNIIDNVNKEYEGFLLCGTLGLWHGKRDIYPEYFHDLTEAVNKCWEKMDYVSAYLVDGCLNLSGSHHDGTNGYYIYPLSPEGCDIITSWEQGYDDDYFDGMNEDAFFKKFVKDKKLIMKFNEKEFQL